MEENKYYTPKIEEFHTGFEYEESNLAIKSIFEDGASMPTVWNKKVFKIEARHIANALERWIIHDGFIRVKYLDHEDFESLGYSILSNSEVEVFFQRSINNEYIYYRNKSDVSSNIIAYNDIHPTLLLIHIVNDNINIRVHIKNKSELKRLLKQLSIL